MRGIDLSHWNGAVGEKILRDSRVELDFCILKHSEGETIRDTMFDRYYSLARDRGILTEPYHFYVGNNFTADRRNKICGRMVEMARASTSGIIWIDWERELDKHNFEFIMSCVEQFKQHYDTAVGIYASYSVLTNVQYVDGKTSVAEYLNKKDMPIWCARYKVNNYVQPIVYGNNDIDYSLMQIMIGDIPVNVNQFAHRCFYDGRQIDLDYNVRFMTHGLKWHGWM